MQEEWTERTELLLGVEAMECLRKAHILIVGIGGVGAYAAEMLVRAGVGEITLLDADEVGITNLNRQLPALHSTLGCSKCVVMAERFRDINPFVRVHVKEEFLKPETVSVLLDELSFDFVVDAIDTITPKCELIRECVRRKIKIVSSMGAGAKWDVSKVQYASIWDTYHCGLSKAVRKRLQKMGIRYKLPVVFSTEAADPKAVKLVQEQNKKSTCGTVSYLPAVFGCYLSSYVIRKLIRK